MIGGNVVIRANRLAATSKRRYEGERTLKPFLILGLLNKHKKETWQLYNRFDTTASTLHAKDSNSDNMHSKIVRVRTSDAAQVK